MFWLWPLKLAVPVYLVILLLSAWVYYYAIAAMRQKVVVGPETLLHSRGEVVTSDADGLRVRVQSELWSASSDDELKPGDAVEVHGIDGLTLRVSRQGQAGRRVMAETREGRTRLDAPRLGHTGRAGPQYSRHT